MVTSTKSWPNVWLLNGGYFHQLSKVETSDRSSQIHPRRSLMSLANYELRATFWGVPLTPVKTTKKAENHSKEGPINTTVGKSGFHAILKIPFPQSEVIPFMDCP